jgi:hypothetical protein
MKDKLTYANVMATLAVGLALAGGVAYAVTAPKNSVRSISIKNGQVTARDLAGLRVVRKQRSISDSTQDGSASYAFVEVGCRSKNERLLSGGSDVSAGGTAFIASSQPIGGAGGTRTWGVTGGVDGGTGTVTALAVCLARNP